MNNKFSTEIVNPKEKPQSNKFYHQRGMLGEHEKSCKSRAFGSWFTSFSSVLPMSQVGYHAGQPIESVVYCFYKVNLIFLWVSLGFKPIRTRVLSSLFYKSKP